MIPTATESYVQRLVALKKGELTLLRNHAGGPLDQSVEGFDLFTGLWWSLRQESQRAPRREVAWLVAKLFATFPIPHTPGVRLARQLARSWPRTESEGSRFRFRMDEMLVSPFTDIEPSLRWALNHIAKSKLDLDWVRLIDDLSVWDRRNVQFNWAEEVLNEMGMVEASR